jgi:hypothetical protein
MAKKSKSEVLDDWRAAEEKYRKIIDQHLDPGSTTRIDKNAAVEIAKARAKADKRLEACLHRLLD